MKKSEIKAEPIKILIVDNDRDLGSLLLDVLKNFGFSPIYAANATDAVREIKIHPDIEIILLDWVLPDMQGEKVIKSFQKFGAACPIIIMSAKKTKEDIITAIKSGAKYYIVKPLNIGQLVLKMNTIAGRNVDSQKLEELSEAVTKETLDFDAYLPITIIDVSKTGCAFECSVEIPVNSVVFLEMESLALKMELPKYTTFSARIANCNPKGNVFKAGAQFVGLPNSIANSLEKLCNDQRNLDSGNTANKKQTKFSDNELIDIISILIIDDQKEDLNVIGNMLTCQGYKVFKALSAESGMDELQRNPAIDLIILDWIMPEVDGIEFLKKTRKILPYTPIIMVTGKTDSKNIKEAIDAGVADYHTKPIDAEALNKSIKNILHRHTKEDIENAPVRKTMIQKAFISLSVKEITEEKFILSSAFKMNTGQKFFIYSKDLNQHLDVERNKRFALKTLSSEGSGNNFEIIATRLGN